MAIKKNNSKKKYFAFMTLGIILSSVILAYALADGTLHSANNVFINTQGFEMSLQKAIDENFLVLGGATPGEDYPISGIPTEYGQNIYISVGGEDKTLAEMVTNKGLLCSSTSSSGDSYSGTITLGHRGEEISVNIGGEMNLQKAINEGKFCDIYTYSWAGDGEYVGCTASAPQWSSCSENCKAGTYQTCTQTTGTESQTVTCVRDQDQATMTNEQLCQDEDGNKPTISQNCTRNDCPTDAASKACEIGSNVCGWNTDWTNSRCSQDVCGEGTWIQKRTCKFTDDPNDDNDDYSKYCVGSDERGTNSVCNLKCCNILTQIPEIQPITSGEGASKNTYSKTITFGAPAKVSFDMKIYQYNGFYQDRTAVKKCSGRIFKTCWWEYTYGEEKEYDPTTFAYFYINGVEMFKKGLTEQESKDAGWKTYTYSLVSGTNEFKWYAGTTSSTSPRGSTTIYIKNINVDSCAGITVEETCTDRILNQNEDQTDCNFPTTENPDCGLCAATCNDGFQNQGETDLDCGGSNCKRSCNNGQTCSVDLDCRLGSRCSSNKKCETIPAPTCADGIKNQGEDKVDCSTTGIETKYVYIGEDLNWYGAQPRCACDKDTDNYECGGKISTEPLSTICYDWDDEGAGKFEVKRVGICEACPTCSDGVKNQDEMTIDCGGNCGIDYYWKIGEWGTCSGGSCAVDVPGSTSRTVKCVRSCDEKQVDDSFCETCVQKWVCPYGSLLPCGYKTICDTPSSYAQCWECGGSSSGSSTATGDASDDGVASGSGAADYGTVTTVTPNDDELPLLFRLQVLLEQQLLVMVSLMTQYLKLWQII